MTYFISIVCFVVLFSQGLLAGDVESVLKTVVQTTKTINYDQFTSSDEKQAEALYNKVLGEDASSKDADDAIDLYTVLVETGKNPLYYQVRIASLYYSKSRFSRFEKQEKQWMKKSSNMFNKIEDDVLDSGDLLLQYFFFFSRGTTTALFLSSLRKGQQSMEDLMVALEFHQNGLRRSKGEYAAIFDGMGYAAGQWKMDEFSKFCFMNSKVVRSSK